MTIQDKINVIFLDIDGVLNNASTTQRYRGFIGIDPDKVELFNQLVQRTGVNVVLSSTWRLGKDWMNTMRKCGLETKHFIGRTPSLPDGIRGSEINAWLSEHPEVHKYAIIDDDSDFYPNQPLFRTNWSGPEHLAGLTKDIANNIEQYFSYDPTNLHSKV